MWRPRAVFHPERMQLHLYLRCPSDSLSPRSTQQHGRPCSKSSPHPGHSSHIRQPEIARWEKRPQRSRDRGNRVLQSMPLENRRTMTPQQEKMEEGAFPGPRMRGAFHRMTRHTSSYAASGYLDTSRASKLPPDQSRGRWPGSTLPSRERRLEDLRWCDGVAFPDHQNAGDQDPEDRREAAHDDGAPSESIVETRLVEGVCVHRGNGCGT